MQVLGHEKVGTGAANVIVMNDWIAALALVTSGAVTAMIECFKKYISRERGLSIRVNHPDGTQIEVSAQNVDTPAVREALEAVVPAGSK